MSIQRTIYENSNLGRWVRNKDKRGNAYSAKAND